MANIAIKGSMGSGHGDFPPRASVMGEPLMKVNGVPVQVQGDIFPPHSDGKTAHPGNAISSRPWFTVSGKPVCCVGDAISCGSSIVTGDGLVRIS